jgi:hypothetical protein
MSRLRSTGPRASAAAVALVLTLGPLASCPVRAQLINNGGFEVGGLSGWTRLDQLGSEGTFALQSGTTSPVNGIPVPAPPGGSFAAMTDAQGPGSHLLYQDFVVPTGQASGLLTFSLFLGNRANDYFTPSPSTLDFSTPALNQQFRADILSPTADPFSVTASDVLLNAYQTKPGDPLVSGYRTISVNISALVQSQAGKTLRLRFAEVDNVSIFQAGIDNVSLTTTAVPEPSSLLVTGLVAGLGTLSVVRRRRRPRTPASLVA